MFEFAEWILFIQQVKEFYFWKMINLLILDHFLS